MAGDIIPLAMGVAIAADMAAVTEEGTTSILTPEISTGGTDSVHRMRAFKSLDIGCYRFELVSQPNS